MVKVKKPLVMKYLLLRRDIEIPRSEEEAQLYWGKLKRNPTLAEVIRNEHCDENLDGF